MVVQQDQLKELFYYILSKFKKAITVEDFLAVCSKSLLSKYYNDTNTSNFMTDGFVAGFINKDDKEKFTISARGKARASQVEPEIFKVALSLVLEVEV